MDPLGDPLTTRPIQTGCEITIELYPSGWFWFIDDPDRQFGNGSVSAWTRTQSDGPEPLVTLAMCGFRFLLAADSRLNTGAELQSYWGWRERYDSVLIYWGVVLESVANLRCGSGSGLESNRNGCRGFYPIRWPNHTEPCVFWLVWQFLELRTLAPL